MTTTLIKARAVASNAGLGPNFDLTSIVAIISQIFAALSACNPTAAVIHKSISTPGPLQKISLRRAVRSHVPNVALRQSIEDAVLHVGKASTQEETNTLYFEATGTQPNLGS